MHVISLDDTKLVVHNGCTSAAQQKWATLVLVLGMLGIYFLASKVVGNLFYFWGGILSHFLCLLLICWYFAPVITTFDKIKGTVKIEKSGLFINKKNEYSLLKLQLFKININSPFTFKRYSKVCLVLKNGNQLDLSNWWDKNKSCQEVLNIIKKFFDQVR